MNRDRNLTKSIWQYPKTFFSSNMPSWDDVEETVNQWLGKNSGITVSEDEKNVYVEAHVPGLTPDDIQVSLDRNTLRIRAEKEEEEEKDEDRKFHRRAQNAFFYQVELPSQVEENTEQAHYQDGVLKISFNKTHRDNIRKIHVKSSSKNGAKEESRTSSSSSRPDTTMNTKNDFQQGQNSKKPRK